MKKTTICLLVAMGLPSLALAHSAGDVLVRAGAITVSPDDSSDKFLGEEFKVDNDTQLGLTVGYMVTDNIGVELLAATPFSHNIALPQFGNIAKTRQLPPTLMAQYYFGNKNSMWRPYVGIGLNYTTFFHEKFVDSPARPLLSDIKLKDSWGVAGQVGMDFVFNKNFIVNGSIWWMDIDTKAQFKLDGKHQSVKTHIDPWVYMMSVGYRF